ncbi:hypothetical protein LXL04_014726 [Taraxacum kok-saghyz]
MASSSNASSGFVRSSGNQIYDYHNRCDCGFPSKIMTSKTVRNPNRDFLVCNNTQANCGFWMWRDEVEGHVPIRALLEDMKADIQKMKRKIYQLLVGFVVLAVVLLFK